MQWPLFERRVRGDLLAREDSKSGWVADKSSSPRGMNPGGEFCGAISSRGRIQKVAGVADKSSSPRGMNPGGEFCGAISSRGRIQKVAG
jgi:hypothetical protein